MFLAAAPYFQKRFDSNDWILAHFQSAIISVGTVTNLGSMLVLTKLQSKASYPKRIIISLLLSLFIFSLLAISTRHFLDVSAATYLVFILAMVFFTSLATGLFQNGAFAFASGFGRSEYMQAIMTGQGVAGVLPALAQIISVLAVPVRKNWEDSGEEDAHTPQPQESTTAAFVFFLTAIVVSAFALFAFLPLVKRHDHIVASRMAESITSIEEAQRATRAEVGILILYKKLGWLAAAVFLCFAITMFFPVFTSQVVSVRPSEDSPRIFQPATFIPLAFLFWNIGDFLGRLATVLPFSLADRPHLLFGIAIARVVFLPMYQLCNIRDRGAVINSDAFYLIIVQFGFGLTNGWLGSSCMMGSNEWVDNSEREVAGGFMGLNLVAGLTAGSLLSFTVSAT